MARLLYADADQIIFYPKKHQAILMGNAHVLQDNTKQLDLTSFMIRKIKHAINHECKTAHGDFFLRQRKNYRIILFQSSKRKNMLLTANHLEKRYGQRTIVHDVSLSIQQGEIVGLLGPIGAGKTTSFYMLLGLVMPTHGQVFLNEEDYHA